jgi:hypothetical protein
MVGTELCLEPISSTTQGRCHHTCVGDDEVKRLSGFQQLVRTGSDARERCEIQLDQFEPTALGGIGTHLRGRTLGLGEVSGGPHDSGAVRRKGPRGLDA